MTKTARAAHFAVLILGGWLVVSPWVLDFAADRTPTTVTVAVGASLAAAVVAAYARPQYHWLRRLEFVLVLFLYLSPWTFGYAGTDTPAANAWMFSTVIGYVAIIQMVEQRRRNAVVDTWADRREADPETPVPASPPARNEPTSPVRLPPVTAHPANPRRGNEARTPRTPVTARH